MLVIHGGMYYAENSKEMMEIKRNFPNFGQ
jgi:hypothetical protein